MTHRTLPTDLPARLRNAGLTVVEVPGWRTRGRPASTGGFNPVGVLWHHTGGTPDNLDYVLWMTLTGRPGDGLPAPLCQIAVNRAGVVFLCAAGRANHAGKARASGTVAAGDGNALYIGVECLNTGSEGWSKAQYDAMVTLGVVLSKTVTRGSAATNRAHRETSVTGKWDPGLLNMDKFRADIAAAMTPPPVPAKDKIRPTMKKLTAAIKQAKADGLTGVANRLKKARAAEWKRARR